MLTRGSPKQARGIDDGQLRAKLVWMSSLDGLRVQGGVSSAVDGSGDSDEDTASGEAPNCSSPLAQMFSQRTLLAEFDLPSSPNAWMAPSGGGRCPAPEPELPLPAGSGRVSPVANLHDKPQPLPRSSAPTWAELTMPASAAELALGTALIALGESTHTASSKAMDELPFTLLSSSADLLGGRAVPRSDVGGCAGLVNLETTEGFLRLACGTMSPPATPEDGDQSGWTSQTSGRGRSRAAPGRSSGSASPAAASDCNPFAPLASLRGEDRLDQSRHEAPATGRHIPHYTAVSPDRSRSHRRGPRGSTGSVSPVENEDDLPPAHFVSSTETMSQIFTLPYMDSEVSIVLHRIGSMLVMEGTLNGSDLGSGDVSASARGRRRGREHDEHLASNFLFFSSGNNTDAATGGGRSLHSTGVHSATPAKAPARSVETASAASFRHKFMWEFDDFGLLLGSDMIVFSNAKHPKFSMQLHDVDQEVSSLACLELWMNNVFQSIPETGICCHKDGFVQGYKLMKTSELPTLSGAMPNSYGARQFQPAAVMEHGASILKFLHTNCDRDGATYWLHRNPNDGSLQLFEVPLGAEEARTGNPDDPESASPRGEQEQQLSISVATLVFRMAERFADEDGDQQYGTAQGGVGERRLRLYRRCLELVNIASAPLLWTAATERIAEFNIGLLSTLETLTLHAARRISSGRQRDHLSGNVDKPSALVANALETLGLLCAARDATASLGSRDSQDAAAKDENIQTEETVRRLTLRVAHICLWLGSQCLAVGCAFPPTSPPRSPRSKLEPDAPACLEPQPDIGAGLHQLALASWLLQQINVPAEPGRAGTEGRQHVVALLTITSRAFAELAQAGVRSGQLKAAAGPAVVKLAAAQAAAGLRGDDPTRFSVASILGMDSEAITLATSSGGWLGQHVHAAAVVPGMDAEQNFNQSVQFLLRALRLCGPGPDSTAPGVGGNRSSTSGQATAARSAAGAHSREPEVPLNRADGGKKRTAPFTADCVVPTVGGTKELVVVPGQRRAKDSEAVGSAISEALGTVYHALGDHYIATGRRTKAHRHCQQGITLFNSICDRPNAALCMAAIGRIVRSGAIETDSERSFSNAAVDVYTTALSWYRQAREMLTPRSAYPRTWRQLRPELAATAAAGAALLQVQLPQLADKQRVDAELETLAALSDAIAAYREVLAEAEGKGNSDAASLDSAPAPAMDMAPLGVNEALSTAQGAKVAAKLGDLEHQLGLLHGWRAAAPAPTAEDARGTRLRKLALTQAEKHLSQAVRWLQLSASGPPCGSGDPIATSPETFPQADVAALRKQMLSQLDRMQTNCVGEDENLESATFKKIVQLSVRASVEVSRLPQQLTASAPTQLPTGVELIRQTSAAAGMP